MRNPDPKRAIYLIAVFLLAPLAGLWAWNTLTELSGLPHAEYRHTLAALLLLMLVRYFTTCRRVSQPPSARKHHGLSHP